MTRSTLLFPAIAAVAAAVFPAAAAPIPVKVDQRIVLMGNGLGSRMLHSGHFETGMHLRHPDKRLFIRNICDEGNTPSFRPHSGRKNQLGFPGAEAHHALHTGGKTADAAGFAWSDEQWLSHLKPDVLIAFFGFNESFAGSAGLEPFRAELDAFVAHTLQQKYNGTAPPELVLVSPTAFQNLRHLMDVPGGELENSNLAAYTAKIQAVAEKHGVRFIDAFTASTAWFQSTKTPLTSDGALLNEAGYERLAPFLIEQIFGPAEPVAKAHAAAIRERVIDKNWMWLHDFKIPNGVHVFGRRHSPFGPGNYPFEIEKLREMTAIRDQAIWAAAQGKSVDIATLDAGTRQLPKVETNYKDPSRIRFLKGDEATATIAVPEGYRIQQWASEQEFPALANPVQLTFDNRGRLWVATMPSYPHWRPGDPLPDDKLLILEDTNNDGKADKQTVFADGLHLPMGFEIAADGVYVSQGVNLILLKDTNGDDKADSREIIFGGFDDHDTHHAIGAFASDPSGAIFLAEGLFLRTSVETAYGPARGSDGGFFRFNPQRRHLERHAQVDIPNPWGIAFDGWGQHFYLFTSGPSMRWMLPGSMKPRYGQGSHNSRELIEKAHLVRPTAGLEFVSSRHFPDEVQGDILLNNTIGFLGTKQHQMLEDGTGYTTKFRQDLTKSTDPNYRPVDLEFAPDGSLFIVDWHNPLIGHMQHSARDPLRDHIHGRIYRVTYPSRPFVTPPAIAGAPIPTLLENLKLPENRARDRSRRELRGRDADEVMAALGKWVAKLDPKHPDHAHHLLEALWVSWGMNRTVPSLLERVLASDDPRARAAATRALRYNAHLVPNQVELLKKAIQDSHGRVKMEATVAASWLDTRDGLAVLAAADQAAIKSDSWLEPVHKQVASQLANQPVASPEEKAPAVPAHLTEAEARALFVKGAEVYAREGHCGTCHQPDGNGLPAAGFPPLVGTRWVTQNDERLIKIALDGLHGPITVKGQEFPGHVPMTGFRGLLDDKEIAAVLTYIRNDFGNQAAPIKPAQVKAVRDATAGQQGFYAPADLLKQHPHQ
jgi:mono/diheme cytochrome c family protein/glucose/arabinose dehydrogenase/lysophospholipase L1-like esterase